jgi:hypothetical protein
MSVIEARRSRPSGSPTRDFWSLVDKTELCWNYTGHLNPQGYGVYHANRRQYRAHRWAWLSTVGEIPDGLVVMHTCDNPRCVRVSHLRLGTRTDNHRDMTTKQRIAHGERHGAAKLTAGQVAEIRARCRPGRCGGNTRLPQPNSIRALAAEFGVDGSTIKRAITGRTWARERAVGVPDTSVPLVTRNPVRKPQARG